MKIISMFLSIVMLISTANANCFVAYTDPYYPNYNIVNCSSNDDIFNSGDKNSEIHAYGGKDIINGGNGGDRIYGDENNDILYGGTRTSSRIVDMNFDELYAGAGDDTLYSSGNADILEGGPGIDTFMLYLSSKSFGANGAVATIIDFNLNDDKIKTVHNPNSGYKCTNDFVKTYEYFSSPRDTINYIPVPYCYVIMTCGNYKNTIVFQTTSSIATKTTDCKKYSDKVSLPN